MLRKNSKCWITHTCFPFFNSLFGRGSDDADDITRHLDGFCILDKRSVLDALLEVVDKVRVLQQLDVVVVVTEVLLVGFVVLVVVEVVTVVVVLLVNFK